MSAYFVVNHVSDEQKTEGLVESYQMVQVLVEDEQGNQIPTMKRLNFVHWPELPVPFVHQEWDENLEFQTIYTPESDEGGSESQEELESLQSEAKEVLDGLTEEEWTALPASVQNFIAASLPDDEDEDDVDDEEEETEEES